MADRPLTLAVMLGSLRRASYNAAIVRALPGLAPIGVTVSNLPSVGIFPIYNADVQAGGFPPVVNTAGDAIRAADGVIIVTPEYNHTIPGGLKNAIDWLSRLPNQPFAGKRIAIMSASQGLWGGLRAQLALRQMFVFLDGHVMNKPEIIVPMIQHKVDAASLELTDAPTRGFIADQLKAFAAFVRS
jgi:chromate reductase, NAD(P)H dehydrogenase (quinone)